MRIIPLPPFSLLSGWLTRTCDSSCYITAVLALRFSNPFQIEWFALSLGLAVLNGDNMLKVQLLKSSLNFPMKNFDKLWFTDTISEMPWR